MSLPGYKRVLIAFVVFLIGATCLGAWFSEKIMLLAIPAGFLFGFFLQKGYLCGASAMSEVLLFKKWDKLFGIWMAILVSMCGFALLNLILSMNIYPKPTFWLSGIIGGFLFGAGSVLGGACDAGSLFKTGMGNLNSMLALFSIPLGITIVHSGFLKGMKAYLDSRAMETQFAPALTLPKFLSLPYWVLALFLALSTILGIYFYYRKKGMKFFSNKRTYSIWEKLFIRPWKPWQSGIAIGLLTIVIIIPSFDVGKRANPLGIFKGILGIKYLITEPQKVFPEFVGEDTARNNFAMEKQRSPFKKKFKLSTMWWSMLIVLFMVIGSFFSSILMGQFKLIPRPPEQLLFAILGGILLGIGTALAPGCFVANVFYGWAVMGIGPIIFTISAILGNWIVSYFYLIGHKNL